MTTIRNFRTNVSGIFAPYLTLCILCSIAGVACSEPKVAPSNTKTIPANASVETKPTATGIKQAESKPVGKEIQVADGPALKSVVPPEGAVLGGVLNDIATTLPKPEVPADTKERGTVTVEVLVNEKGEVVASSVVSGPQPLWRPAGAAARQAKFDPPLKDGKPVKVAGVLTFDFK